VILVVIAVRILYVFPAAYVPRLLFPRIRARGPYPPWQAPAIISWAAFAIPLAVAAFSGGDPDLFPRQAA
jgi:CPA1 family monovalent cation:H+ antiporter